MSSPESQIPADDAIEHALAVLSEHFDAVQILATTTGDGATDWTFRGAGNWFARTGMAREFLKQDQQIDQAKRIAQETLRSDEDDDPGF